ncbi:MAG: TIGR03668 family PPOX class F420-dependent oxidoreductase [Nitrolancea sp.]
MTVELNDRECAFIDSGRVAHLATTDAAGDPHVVPVCYVYDGQRFFIAIDEKPKRSNRTLKRVRNIVESGRAALVIDRYDDANWSRLAWLMVRGSGEMLGPENPDHHRIVAALRDRYAQYREMALERAPIIAITPERISSWGALDESAP